MTVAPKETKENKQKPSTMAENATLVVHLKLFGCWRKVSRGQSKSSINVLIRQSVFLNKINTKLVHV